MKIFFCILLALSGLISSAQQQNIQHYIQEALSNSPLLKDYQNQIRSNRIDSMRIRAGYGPQVNAISNNLYAPVINGWGYDEAITNGADISAQVSVSKEITGKNQRESQYRSLHVQNLSLQNTSKVSEQDLIKNVSLQYISAYGSLQQYRYGSEILDLLRKEEQVLKRLTEQNIYKQTEYLSFAVTLQQQESQLIKNKSQYQKDLSSLNYLCGIQDTSFTILDDPGLGLASLPKLQNSLFYQSFVNDSLKLSVEDQQIDYAYRPKINLFGDAGYNSSLVYQPWKNFGASAGINLSMPIYDGKQRKMQHDKIRIAEETRQTYRDYFVRQYHQQIYQLLQQLSAKEQLSASLQKQAGYSKTLIDANHRLLETGNAQITDYILAINNYLSVRNDMVQNTIEYYLLINEINYWSRLK